MNLFGTSQQWNVAACQ